VRLYVGDTRSAKLLAALQERDAQGRLLTGQLVQRGRLAPWLRERQAGKRGWLWAFDNAAFDDWKRKRDFDADAFAADLELIAALPRRDKPSWIVLPDIVAGGERSLELSLTWLDVWPGLGGVPVLLALQEGIDPTALAPSLQLKIDGWFIGGATWAWKMRAAAQAVAWCRDPRNPAMGDHFVHVGRVGSAAKIVRCRELGVDSVDSNAPLWSQDAWRRALDALRGPLPHRLPGMGAAPPWPPKPPRVIGAFPFMPMPEAGEDPHRWPWPTPTDDDEDPR
jgi:hypothetical protein